MTAQQVTAVLFSASRFLGWPRLDARRALEMVLPYAEYEAFKDASPVQNFAARGTVCAVVGDCYSTLGEFERAAGWYLRARDHMRAGGVAPFFATCYAVTVVDGRLAGHATLAAECLREVDAWWRAKPLMERLFYEVFTLWWLKPSAWPIRLRKRRLLGQLEALAQGER